MAAEPSRAVSFTKDGITYAALIFSISQDQAYKARVIMLHNPGEDIKLYTDTIKRLIDHGYEVFFYQMMDAYGNEDQVRREMNRIVKMCVDDLDQQNYHSHKVHLVGNYIGAAKALHYGINGYYKYRIKSIVAVNPTIKSKNRLLDNDFMRRSRTSFTSLFNSSRASSGIILDKSLFTSDPSQLKKLSENNYDFSKLTNLHMKTIQTISKDLVSKNKASGFQVKNVLVIHSVTDPLSKYELSELFIENCVHAENAAFLKYDHGLTNLFIERKEIFDNLMDDLIAWFDNN